MNNKCWCCHQPLGSCACQDEATEICPGCNHCEKHCVCRQLETEGAATIDGMAPNAPIQTNDKGARQSAIPFRCDLLPARAILAVSRVLKHGADTYPDPDNWRRIPRVDHVNHALAHLFAHGAGDDSGDHLEHATCRLLFALETT
jgi:hypothetical protein